MWRGKHPSGLTLLTNCSSPATPVENKPRKLRQTQEPQKQAQVCLAQHGIPEGGQQQTPRSEEEEGASDAAEHVHGVTSCRAVVPQPEVGPAEGPGSCQWGAALLHLRPTTRGLRVHVWPSKTWDEATNTQHYPSYCKRNRIYTAFMMLTRLSFFPSLSAR